MAEEKPLRIVMFGHKHIMSREGGIEIVVKALATRMSRLNHKVVVYDRSVRHVSGSIPLEIRDEIEGVRIVPVWTIEKKGLAAMTSSLSAAWKAGWGNFDVVHIHAEGPAAMCGLVKLIGKLCGKRKRVIVTVHGLDWARSKWSGFASRYIKFGEKQAVKYADEIIVLSHRNQEYFQNRYGRKTVYIPNGADRPTPAVADEIRRIWGLEKDSYVLFLGRIVPEKGLRYLVEAWKQVTTDKKLVIVGGPSDTEEFMDELKRISSENVIFTGFQQGRVLEELYSNSYFYCLPSDIEGMPLTLLEALSYGSCCVVSDIAECTEVVEDKAVVFPKGNTGELARTLQELLDKPDKVYGYREGTAEYVLNKYNWDDVARRTIEVYRGRKERYE